MIEAAATTRSELINQHSIDLDTMSSQIYGRLFVFGGGGGGGGGEEEHFNDRDWFVNQPKIKEIAARVVRYKHFDIVYMQKRQRGTYFKDFSKSLVKLKTIPKNRWLGKMRNKILEQTLAGLREENGQSKNGSEKLKLFPYDILRKIEEMEIEIEDEEENIEKKEEDKQSPEKFNLAAAIAAGSPTASKGEQEKEQQQQHQQQQQQQQQQQSSQKIVVESNSNTSFSAAVAKQNEIMGQLVLQIMSGNTSVKELLQQNTSNIDALQVIAQHYDKFLKLEKNF